MINKMTKIKNNVREILIQYPAFRDNDMKLIAAFYYKNYNHIESFKTMSALDFFKKFGNGEYISPDAITRVRRKLQEEDKSLRGNKYKSRHEEEEEVRTNIHNL